MADAAVIIVREEITDVATAAIDLSPVEADDPVVITGYGCEEAVGGWDYTHQRLRVAESKALAFDRVIHEGSFIYPEERDTLAVTMGGIYLITPGPTDFPHTATDAGADAAPRTPTRAEETRMPAVTSTAAGRKARSRTVAEDFARATPAATRGGC